MTNKSNAQVHLIYGEDEFSVSAQARAILRQAIPAEEETLGLETIDARAGTVADALNFIQKCREAILTVGFLGGRKAVWLRNANFLDQGILGKSKDVRARLKDLGDAIEKGLPAGHWLVITAPDVDEKSEFFKACQAAGETLAFKSEKAWQREKPALAFAAEAFRELGLAAAGDALEAFVLKVGTDSRQLRQEAEKLAIYLGAERTVRLKDIEAIVAPTREIFSWDLEDALGKRDLGAALRVLRQLLFQKEEPIRLMIGIESRFRSLFLLREALDKRWIRLSGEYMVKDAMTAEQEQLFYQALNDNRLKSAYVGGKRTQQALNFTSAELDACRARILATRRQLVSSSLPPPLAMELLVIKLCQ
jgi:DNA polymerase-3 subunit delta